MHKKTSEKLLSTIAQQAAALLAEQEQIDEFAACADRTMDDTLGVSISARVKPKPGGYSVAVKVGWSSSFRADSETDVSTQDEFLDGEGQAK